MDANEATALMHQVRVELPVIKQAIAGDDPCGVVPDDPAIISWNGTDFFVLVWIEWDFPDRRARLMDDPNEWDGWRRALWNHALDGGDESGAAVHAAMPARQL